MLLGSKSSGSQVEVVLFESLRFLLRICFDPACCCCCDRRNRAVVTHQEMEVIGHALRVLSSDATKVPSNGHQIRDYRDTNRGPKSVNPLVPG